MRGRGDQQRYDQSVDLSTKSPRQHDRKRTQSDTPAMERSRPARSQARRGNQGEAQDHPTGRVRSDRASEERGSKRGAEESGMDGRSSAPRQSSEPDNGDQR